MKPIVTIVMAVKDNLEWTQKGIASILKQTQVPYELLVIDNGSALETQQYLSEEDLLVIRNEENIGCAKAWNQGIRAAQGEYVCIVNNDIEVHRGWLKYLINFYQEHKFPMISPAMREGDFDYDLNAYRQTLCETLKGRHFEDEFRGIAMFASQTRWFDMGLFDEQFRGGKYEDEDLFFRIKEKGLSTAVIPCCVMHHYGSKTVNLLKDKSECFEAHNRSIFLKKWSHRYVWRKWRRLKIKWRHAYILGRYGVRY